MDKILIYTTPTCSKCKRIKEQLDNANVLYEENQDIKEMMNLGIKQVPYILFNGKHIETSKIKEWIKEGVI